MANIQDKEIQQYRDLMEVPDKFEDGFGPKMIVAALFLGFLMIPGSIYLGLFMGAGLGPAARWVTVILFAEAAKRSMKSLRKQEIFLLFYMTGIALGMPFQNFLWYQYLVQSPATVGMGVASEIPAWIAPSKEVIEQTGRTFFTRHWLPPMAFIFGTLLLGRIDHFGLGYALYRLTSHVEKLPFPMAPVGALGVTALADSGDETQRWRWRCFSLGGVMGLAFGAIYAGVPAVTSVLFNHPVKIIPIPWLDLTAAVSTRDFMPAVPLNLVFDLTLVIVGMVLPFWAVVGGFIGLIVTWILNPILYHNGMLTTWQPGMGVVDTLFSNHIDFYLSFSIGLMFAIFLVSISSRILKPMFMRWIGAGGEEGAAERKGFGQIWRELLSRDRERGDISILMSLGIYLLSTITYIGICTYLMPGDPVTGKGRFPWLFFLGFAFLYQPIISYTNAKLEGMVGQTVAIPLVREAAFILSGYKGAAIWFAPIPMTDYAGAVRGFRILELTGTKLTGVIKVELLAYPIVALTTLLFSELIWRIAPIPSETYPFTQEVWHLNALNFSLTVTSTMEGSSQFLEAIKWDIIGWGLGSGLLSFILLSFLNLPTFLVYGAVRGLGQTTPGQILPEFIGALIGRFYLQRKFGHQTFKRYIAIVVAGFMAGVGLVGMASVAIALIVKSTTTLGY
ncbi:MAG: peptide transporter [Planctomycetes bacterium]|nr:peptide transporter [Planctomycetota bacterium]